MSLCRLWKTPISLIISICFSECVDTAATGQIFVKVYVGGLCIYVNCGGLLKSVEKIQTFLKLEKKLGQFASRYMYVYTVDCTIKCFVGQWQCKVN